MIGEQKSLQPHPTNVKGGERTVAAQRMEVSNADKVDLRCNDVERQLWAECANQWLAAPAPLPRAERREEPISDIHADRSILQRFTGATEGAAQSCRSRRPGRCSAASPNRLFVLAAAISTFGGA